MLEPGRDTVSVSKLLKLSEVEVDVELTLALPTECTDDAEEWDVNDGLDDPVQVLLVECDCDDAEYDDTESFPPLVALTCAVSASAEAGETVMCGASIVIASWF